jgi:hypothetical protein
MRNFPEGIKRVGSGLEFEGVKAKRRNIWPGTGLRENASLIIAAVLVSALLVVLVLSLYQRMTSQGAHRNEYAGRVMDKWVTYHETELGTRVSRHLLIKAKNGETFQVTVGPELYEQAKVDLWVIKNKDDIKILAAEP